MRRKAGMHMTSRADRTFHPLVVDSGLLYVLVGLDGRSSLLYTSTFFGRLRDSASRPGGGSCGSIVNSEEELGSRKDDDMVALNVAQSVLCSTGVRGQSACWFFV